MSPKTINQLLADSLQLAEKLQISEHKVKILLSDIAGCSVPALQLNQDKELTPAQLSQFSADLKDLFNNKPIQYIQGKTEFYGLSILVNENVLIPRPETEGLVEWIVLREQGKKRILDIGTGSGAIALALKNLNPDFNLSATDISPQSIKIARENAKRLSLDVTFICTDLYPKNKIKYDIIVSNPPYISAEEYAVLDEEIRLYEPKLALFAEKDGLAFYRRILKQAGLHLNRGGKIYLETGETQQQAIEDIAYSNGYNQVEMKQDLAGRSRYLCVYNKDILTKRHNPIDISKNNLA